MPELSQSLDFRVSALDDRCTRLSSDVETMRADYYDAPGQMGIRTKVIIVWYSIGAVIAFTGTVFGTVCGWVLRGLS